MDHNKLIEESEKIFNNVIKEGSGGEQKQLRRIDAKHDGLMYDPKTGKRRPVTVKKGKELESGGQRYRLVKGKWILASEMENSNQDPNLKEGSGGEQSLHRQIAAAIKSGGSNPATNPLLRRLEARLKSKHKGSDQRARRRGMLVIPKEDREPKDLKQRLQQRQTMRQARPVKTVGEKLPK